MRRVVLAATLAFLAIGTAVAQEARQVSYTRLSYFRIPFQVAEGDEVAAIKEIQLYVAKNRGPWELYTSVSPAEQPNQRHFLFRSSGDGEYWFAVRTIDRDGNAIPARVSDLQPELRVIVDTKPPKITLTPLPREGNRVGVRWQIRDPHLNFESFELEYRVGEQGRWKRVPTAAFKIAGEATWEVNEEGTVYVRAQIQDKAHNLGIAQCEIPPADPRENQPPASVEEMPAEPAGSTAPAEPASPPTNFTFSQGNTMPSFDSPLTPPQLPQPADSASGQPSTPALPPAPPTTPQPTPTPQPTADIKPADRSIVRHTAINIDYTVEDVGPSGIGSVQLWYTTDGGRTWALYGEDADREPPFAVDLSRILQGQDGLVGFRLIVKSGVGLGDSPPTSGDKPDIWVELDRTPPLAQLIEVTPGQGSSGGTIVIRWRADDPNLGPTPISLYYGINGNWKPIATQIANTGVFEWSIPMGQVPPQVRIGLDVIDQAGNRTFVQSDEITIDLSRPKARVTGIVPADGSVRR